MSTILQAREDLIKRLNVMVRRINGVTGFILTGNSQCSPSEVNAVISSSDNSVFAKIASDINFLISEFLSPISADSTEADNRIIKKYSFESGINAEITICGEDNFPAADWWVSYLDTNGAAQAFYGEESKCPSDPVKEEPQEEDEEAEELTDDFDDDFEEIQPEPPANEEPSTDDNDDFYNNLDSEFQAVCDKRTFAIPNSIQVSDNKEPLEIKNSPDELWSQIYRKAALAKGAIAGGSIIRAGEVVNELRTQLIELICRQNGITEDYIHSIDLLPNDYQKDLAKTYPSKLESGAIISALAAELALFEQLIK